MLQLELETNIYHRCRDNTLYSIYIENHSSYIEEIHLIIHSFYGLHTAENICWHMQKEKNKRKLYYEI